MRHRDRFALVQTDLKHEIETPEMVTFEYRLAGVVTRAIAWFLDMTIVLLLLIGAVFAMIFLAGVSGGWLVGPALAGMLVLIFLLQWGYFVFFEWRWDGQTPGKRAMRIKVVQDTGLRVGFHQALVRNLMRLLDALPLKPLVAAVVSLVSHRRQRLGDLVAGTIVIHEKQPPPPSSILPASERHNSLLEDRAATATARNAVTPRLRELMMALAMRREALETQPRLSLFRDLAEHLERLGIERPGSFSDERFVLSTAAAVLGVGAGRPEAEPPGCRQSARPAA